VDNQTEVDLTNVASVAALAFTCLRRHNVKTGPGRMARALLHWKPLTMNGGFLIAVTMVPGEPQSIKSLTVGCSGEEEKSHIPAWRSEAIAMIQSIWRHQSQGYRTSWESRNPDQGLLGGAIVTGKGLYIACRGTGQEYYDEAMALVIPILMGWAELNHARDIARLSGNPHFVPLCLETIAAVLGPASTR
jgi:hypothetical protein